MSKRPRKYVGMREKWAAALSMLLPQEVRDELRAKRVPAKTIIGMFDQGTRGFSRMGRPRQMVEFYAAIAGGPSGKIPARQVHHRKDCAGRSAARRVSTARVSACEAA